MSDCESEDWDFKHQCGAQQPFQVAVTDPTTGQPQDLTGANVKWIFGNFGVPPVLVLSTGEGGAITTGGTNGLVTGKIPAAGTADIASTEAITVDHQMFLTLAEQEPFLIQQGKVTFSPKLRES